jgi:hypothetical protein
MNLNLTPKSLKIPQNLVKGKLVGSGGFAKVFEFLNTEIKIPYAGKVVEKVSLLRFRTRQKLVSEIKNPQVLISSTHSKAAFIL